MELAQTLKALLSSLPGSQVPDLEERRDFHTDKALQKERGAQEQRRYADVGQESCPHKR